MNACLISVCHDQTYHGFQRMAKSASNSGWTALHIQKPWRGFVTKLVEARNALPALKSAGFDTIAFVDAFDVLVFGGPESVEPHWNGSGAIMSCEKACWPDGDKANRYPPNPKSDWRYINSGGYIANIDFMGDVLLAGCEKADDDQRWMTDQYLAHLEDGLVRRDDGCELFQSLAHCFSFPHQSWRDIFEIRDGKPWNKSTNTKPFAWHANGGGSSSLYHDFLFEYL